MVTAYVPRKTKKENPLAEYPCADYLHNALRFLEADYYTNAYTEICYALMKSGAELTEHERFVFGKLIKGKPTIGGKLERPTNIQYPWAECPKCGGSINVESIREYVESGKVTYCHHCGSALDWSVDDEE